MLEEWLEFRLRAAQLQQLSGPGHGRGVRAV